MAILQAFLVGGLVCVLFMLAMKLFKIPPPMLLTGGICLGAILAAVGLMAPLGAFGGGGIIVMVPGAGEAMYQGFLALLNGNATPIVGFTIVLLLCIVLGIIDGIVTHNKGKAR